MAELPPLDLSSTGSVLEHRELMIADLPEILRIVGAQDQITALARGQHDDVVRWFQEHVSTGAHGVNAGEFGLTRGETALFNPFAQRNGLIAQTRLWTPDDELPPGARIGDIVDYSVTPDWDNLPEQLLVGDDTLVVDATVDGTIGRIITGLGTAVRTQAATQEGGRGRLTILTGMRAVKSAEGTTGLYKQFLPEGADPDTPIDVAFPSATDAAIAILKSRCSKFEQFYEVEDPEAGRKPADRIHPTLGGRTWIARYYHATDAETGRELLVTVVNGEPLPPTGSVMNRDRAEPAPKAAAAFMDYLRLPLTMTGNKNLAISYAHLGRIGAELLRAVQEDETLAAKLRSLQLVGNMPQPATWDKMRGEHHNGGTLAFKELYPYIKALGALLGIDPRDLSRHTS